MYLSAHLPTLAAVVAMGVPCGWAGAVLAQRETRASAPSTALMIAASVLVFAWSAIVVPFGYLLIATLLLAWTLLVLCAVDALCLRLPDFLTLPLAAAGLLLSLYLPDRNPADNLIGAMAGFATLYAISWLYRLVRGREGLGLGDAKLAAAAGAWVGWQVLPQVVLVGSLAGLLWVAVAVCFRGRSAMKDQVPFGVPLCIAFWLEWLSLNGALF